MFWLNVQNLSLAGQNVADIASRILNVVQNLSLAGQNMTGLAPRIQTRVHNPSFANWSVTGSAPRMPGNHCHLVSSLLRICVHKLCALERCYASDDEDGFIFVTRTVGELSHVLGLSAEDWVG